MKKALIIGSGFSGCMFAMMLKKKNWDVTVFDRAPMAGGGVRTFYHGGHPYTYGPRSPSLFTALTGNENGLPTMIAP